MALEQPESEELAFKINLICNLEEEAQERGCLVPALPEDAAANWCARTNARNKASWPCLQDEDLYAACFAGPGTRS
jgi:hypothetical protein